MMAEIKFAHDYPKLWKQTEARLIESRTINGKNLHKDLIEYDTKFIVDEEVNSVDYYQLPKSELIQLIFLGNNGIPFCTLRRYTPDKEVYYHRLIGYDFKITITGDSK